MKSNKLFFQFSDERNFQICFPEICLLSLLIAIIIVVAALFIFIEKLRR